MKIFTLIRAFQKAKGRSPTPSELAQLKKQADSIPEKGKFLQFPPGGKGGKGPNKIMDELVDEQGNYIGDRIPGMDKEGNFVEDIREFTRKEDLYEGNKKGLEKLLKSGAVKKGVAPKTKKTKDPVDPKFKRAVESQEERARLIKEFEARNKESAFNFAFKKYKEIDKKPMEMDEVISIYTNLNKYPKGRDIIIDDIADIQRGHILPAIGNRSREMLVSKLNQMIRPKKQPNPFKKATDEVSEQIEMDFTDWDPKGMKGGGIAHMLGQPRVPMMYGGEVNPIALRKKLMELVTAMQTAPEEEIPMLALEARRIRDQLAKFEQEEPSIMEAAEEMQEGPMTLEERIKEKIYPKEEVTSDATIYAPGTITSTTGGEKVIDDQITINELARIPNYMNMKRPVRASMMSGRLQPSTKGLEALKQLIKGDITEGDPRNYEKGGRVPMMYGGDPGFAFEYGGSWADWNDNHKHMMPVTEYIGTKLPKDRLPFRQELSAGGLAGLPAIQIGPVGINPKASGSYSSNQPYGPNYKEKTLSNTIGFDATIDLPGGFKIKGDYGKHRTRDRLYDSDGNFLDKRVRDDHDRYNVGVEWSKKFANGGRIGFDNGGFNKGRRNFLKLAAGLASVPFIGKFFKLAKPAAKAVKAVETSNAAGMPAWFPKLVDKVMKEGKDLGGTVERQIVKEVELPSGTKVVVDHDLNTGNTIVDVGMGKHGFSSGRYGQPARLELTKGEWIEPTKGKKGVKTKDEFSVEEAEFTGGHPENIKFEESSIESYGNHASDFSEVEKYATGKNVDKYNIKGTRKSEADEFAQGRAEARADEWQPDWDDSLPEDYAKGGLAHMLGR